MDIMMCVPSYKRAGQCTTLAYVPDALVYVCESEVQAYQQAYPQAALRILPFGIQGNISRVRNIILDDFAEKIVAIFDDDMKEMGYIEGGKYYRLPSSDVYAFLVKYTQMALDCGARLWGVNVNSDFQTYRENLPFGFVSVIGGPFMVHVKSPLRFDERFFLKGDFDIALQHLYHYRRILRVNKYNYTVKQGGSDNGQTGGCAEVRTLASEQHYFQLLQQKWGTEIVRQDTLASSRSHAMKRKRVIDINPKFYPPLKGV